MAGEVGKQFGAWKTATLTSSTSSSAVDLGHSFQKLLVLIPTLNTSGSTTITVAMTSAGTYFPLYALKSENTGDHVYTTGGATTTKAVVFDIGGAQFIKIVCSASQTSETYYVRGFNPSGS